MPISVNMCSNASQTVEVPTPEDPVTAMIGCHADIGLSPIQDRGCLHCLR